MEKNDGYLFNLIVAAAAIAGTLFLLNKWATTPVKKDCGCAGNTEKPLDNFNNTQLPQIQKVEVVEPVECFFPGDMLVTYTDGTVEPNWGELNPNAPNIPGNNF